MDFGTFANLFGPDPLIVVRTITGAVVSGLVAGSIAVALTVMYRR